MSASPTPGREPKPLHIDTDPGVDDLLALAFCLASPEVRVTGITTVAGNAPLDAVTENAGRFLALAGETIRVGRGAARPLHASPVTAGHVHGEDGRLGVDLPPVAAEPASAEEVFRHSLADRPATVLALGPLTNVARLLEQDPGLFGGSEIVWMGGTLSRGNVTPAAEFNSYADPDAADLVLASRVPVRVVGLDATHRVIVRAGELPPGSFGDSARGRVLGELLDRLMKAETSARGEPCTPLHDPCAAAAVVAPDLFRFERRSLRVRVDPGEERGRLVTGPAGEGDVRYARGVDGGAVRSLCLERLGAWARGEAILPRETA
jgi:inosine-uridine nucleoside N-ribohydrolase